MRLGVFGGTFDPPHFGHLLLASDAVERLSLDRVIFVPAYRQPLKDGRGGASPMQRLAMTALLIGDDPRFVLDGSEVERGGLSFTVDTLRDLHRRYRGADFHLLLGTDAVELLPKWREPAEVLRLARLVVVGRGDLGATVPEAVRALAVAGAGEPLVLAARRFDVSSTEIRARLAEGRPIRGFVPDAVAAYIAGHGLYRGPAAER
ncbi:MAG: nicotinate-nucleotide adenylyltransferase [Gemmatimonadaceae bacterium]|nr:nicotinate-nucleotide adenylyltransferase [Gemmatimonadaceae bacterium]